LWVGGTYYPGFDNPVESLNIFMNKPDDIARIYSHAFEGRIYKRLGDAGYEGNVSSLRNIL